MTYCFGAPVSAATSATDFMLHGYNPSMTAKASHVSVTTSNDKCVVATFPTGTSVKSYAMASAMATAASGKTGKHNPPGSVSLTGSTVVPKAGNTSRPQLTSATVTGKDDQVTYTFSTTLESSSTSASGASSSSTGGTSTAANASDFAAYLANGRALTGKRIVSESGKKVVVGFATKTTGAGTAKATATTGAKATAKTTGAKATAKTTTKATGASTTGSTTGSTVSKAVREGVAPGAVKSMVGTTNVPGSTGKSTAVPSVTSATLATAHLAEVNVTFDKAVGSSSATAHKFVAYTADGHPYDGEVAAVTSSKTVSVGFPGLTNAGTKIERVAVLQGAVHMATAPSATSSSKTAATTTTSTTAPSAAGGTGAASTAVSNTIGSVSVKNAATPPSPAAGPALTSAASIAGGRAARFTFSEPLEMVTSCIPKAKPSGKSPTASGAASTSGTRSKGAGITGSAFTTGTTIGARTGTTSLKATTSKATAKATSTTCNPSDFEMAMPTGAVAKGTQIAAYETQGSTPAPNSVVVLFAKPSTAKASTTPAAFSVKSGAVTGALQLKNPPMSVKATAHTSSSSSTAKGS